jgi:predicted RNase H-like nuclease (RuvC/YqgF family)
MSDFGGLGGALLISQQLDLYRWEDYFARSRDANAVALSDAAWRNQYNDLVNRYNRLLADANKLAKLNDETIETQAGTIADLKAANDALRAEKEQLRSRLVDVEGELAVLRGLDRELHPEAYIYR